MNKRTKSIVSLGKLFHTIYQYCMICGSSPVDMAHLVGKNVTYKKNGIEQNDPTKMESVVPLCRSHHLEYDRKTSLESRIKFWQKHGKRQMADKLKFKYESD